MDEKKDSSYSIGPDGQLVQRVKLGMLTGIGHIAPKKGPLGSYGTVKPPAAPKIPDALEEAYNPPREGIISQDPTVD